MIYETLPTNSYCGNSSCKTFDFDFYIENENQLKVYLIDENEIKKELKYKEDYSINEFKNKSGSYIIFPIENSSYETLNENQRISLELNLEISQEVQYNNSSLLNLETLEYSLDYLTRLIQILNRKISLCLKVEEGLKATPEELLNSIKESKNTCIENKTLAQKYTDEAKKSSQEAQEKLTQIEKYTEEITPEKYTLNDLTNLSTEGRTTGASLAMPSSNFIVLEWGASGSAYIAPANGYINAQYAITGTTGNFSLQLNINERMFDKKWAYLPSTTSSSILCTTIPVKKGDTVSLIYQYPQNTTITTTLIRFFYAEGEV
ncbi:MAG: hypothetical protein IJD57_01195 [Candidatus Gastranaerophilales bacterium]|nr:hypothetical protein [Candidatus Gastranaerophilales bacterium]